MNLLLGMPPWLLYLIIFIYLIWQIYFKNARILKFCKYQNGPSPLPFIGNLSVFSNKNIIDSLKELKEKYSMPFNMWIWNDYYYITDNPREIKALLCNTTKSFSKAPFYDDLIKVMVGDLFIMTASNKYKEWKMERSLVARAFTPSMWSCYALVSHKNAMKVVNKLNNIHRFKNLSTFIHKIAYDNFMESFLDIETNCTEDHDQLELSLSELMEMLSTRSTLSRLIPRWFWHYYTKDGQRFNYLRKDIRERVNQFVSQKRQSFLEIKESIQDCNKLKLIELLLLKEAEESTTVDVYKQIFLIYFTSIETTSLTLFYTLILLGMHPEVQEKVYQEVLSKVGHREIVAEELSKLEYLEQTILETMRLFPIIPITGRHIENDIDLGDKVLPKGANAAIMPYLVHRNEKYWPNPESFDPDRFSPENVKNIVVGSYIPFLIGPRDCIGRHVAMAQIKIFTANIVRNYKTSVDPKVADNLKLKLYILPKPIHDFDVRFERRTIK